MAATGDDEVLRVAEMFGGIARALATHVDVQPILDIIVRLAVENLNACEYAGVSVATGRTITSPASSHEVPAIVDAIQAEVDEGPCIDAIKEHEVFKTGNLAAEGRWPKFARRAHDETGISSILAFRLFVDGETFGALNLYSTKLDAFDDDTDVGLASVFAAHASVALASANREEQLERKALSRDVIGRAKGILMGHSEMTDAEAFDILRRASQRLNLKVVDVAGRVASTGSTDSPEDA